MQDEFLGYLNDWQSEVDSCTDLTPKDKAKRLLSKETMEGLHITGRGHNIRQCRWLERNQINVA